MPDKCLHFTKEVRSLWNIKMGAVPIIIGALGTVWKSFSNKLYEQEIRKIMETTQTRLYGLACQFFMPIAFQFFLPNRGYMVFQWTSTLSDCVSHCVTNDAVYLGDNSDDFCFLLLYTFFFNIFKNHNLIRRLYMREQVRDIDSRASHCVQGILV